MSVVLGIDLAIGLLGFGLGAIRWLRVAQREHYLGGSVATFARRWWFVSVLNATMVVAALASWIAMSFWPPTGVIAASVACVGPIGLGLRGRTSKLAWTARLRRVAIGVVVIWAVVGVASAVLAGLRGIAVATVFLSLAAPLEVDLVLDMLRPIEARLSRHFVDEASTRLVEVDPKVVAITGSYGKTSTKGYVAHLLSGRFRVLPSPRSFNNQSGLARTVNELLLPGTEIFVAEMGTYGVGEIATMVQWIRPDVAVLTAIGPVHLERFETLETTLRAKSEISEDAEVVVLNVDDPYLCGYADELVAAERTVWRCSSELRDADVAVVDLGSEVEVFRLGTSLGIVDLGAARTSIALSNVACAIAVALVLGVEQGEILQAAATLPVAENRLSHVITPNGVTVIDDTYNSNPRGAELALQALSAAAEQGHKVMLVTPGMVELGSEQFGANAAFSRAAAAIVSHFVVVGRTNRAALIAGLEAAASEGDVCEVSLALDREDAVRIVREELAAGDVVLYENDLPDHYA